MSNWQYCRECGSKLVEREYKEKGFSPYTGKPVYRRQMICPNFGKKGKDHDSYFKSEKGWPDPDPDLRPSQEGVFDGWYIVLIIAAVIVCVSFILAAIFG